MDTKLIIKYVPLDQLIPAPYNPRKINQSDFEALQRSLDTFGWAEPIVVNQRTGFIVGGHMRAKAAQAIGMTEAPVVYIDVDAEQEKALNVSLNKISGEFDNDQLAELLSSLDADLVTLTGFDEDWAELLQPAPLDIEPDIEKSDTIKAPKFTTDDLRVLAKSIYPTQEAIIIDFLNVVDTRADKH